MTTTPHSPQSESLARELSLFALIALAINGMVGAGIFGLPSAAAAQTGAFSPVLFAICGLLMAALMATFAQASSYFHGTGGPILYTRAAFGSFVGFQTGWCLYVSRVTSLAANGNLLAVYLGAFVPGVDTGPARIAVIGSLTLGFAFVNIVGVRQGMRSIVAITIAKFVPLLAFVAIGLTFLTPEPFAELAIPAREDFGPAVLLVFYAFIGFEGALVPAGESRDPKRDIPRAMFATAAFTTVLYVLIQTICVAVTPDLAQSERPLADAAGAMIGAVGVWMISIGAVLSILGNFAAAVLSAPRMTYALALDGSLPRCFGSVHPRFHTPHVSIAVYCGLGFALGATGSFAELAVTSSLARLLGYTASVAALPRLQRRYGREEGALRLPGGLTIPVVAFVICLWLLTQVEPEALWKTGLLVGLGTALFASASKRRHGADPAGP